MDAGPSALSLNWNPFDSRLPVKSVLGNLLSLGGAATAADQNFGKAPDQFSVSSSGEVAQKTIVSEVTTIQIQANSAYHVRRRRVDANRGGRRARIGARG